MSTQLRELLDSITIDDKCCRVIFEEVLEQTRCGLTMHAANPDSFRFDKSDFMMLDSGISNTPTGRECGTFYGIDMGGTNVRAVRVILKGDGKIHDQTESSFSLLDVPFAQHLPRGVMDRRATATELFDGVVYAVKHLMDAHGEDSASATAKPKGVGFTCSFGINQRSLNSAILTQWSKGFETGQALENPADQVIGRDVLHLVNEAFRRNNINASMNCIVNDTVSTMLTGAFSYSHMTHTPGEPLTPCLVGVVIGTGFNVCYYEPDAYQFNYKGRVINSEAGGLARAFPRCAADAIVDFESPNRGRQIAEKAISGLYLGEVVRLLLIETFKSSAPSSLWSKGRISTQEAATVYNDARAVEDVTTKWFDRKLSDEEQRWVSEICDAVFVRSARLAGSIIAAFTAQTGESSLAVGVDGSLFVKNVKYQEEVVRTVNRLNANKRTVVLRSVIGGSCLGAALLAACAPT